MTEFADVRRTRSRSSASPNASRVSRWQSSKLPATAYARTFAASSALNIVSCASCVGLTRPSGIEHDDARVRHAVKRVGDGAAGVARGGRQHGQRLIAGVERRHQPRHRPRADVLERQRRTVKQLEREDARLDLDERNREVQRLDDDRFERRSRRARRACTAEARGRRSRSACGVGSRASSSRRPRLDRFRHVEPAVRAPAPRRARVAQRRPPAAGRRPRVVTKRMWDRTRAPCWRDRRHVGLRLAADLRPAPRPSSRPRPRAAASAPRTARRATGRIPTGCSRARRPRPPRA